jgi:hypothetical protein
MSQAAMSEKTLDKLQRDTFEYFLKESNRANGMVPDNTRQGSHASIAPIGFALTAYTIGVERGFITRSEAIERTLTTLRFFRDSEQSEEADATGYKGFYYHFLYMDTGRRAWESELSTIDSTFLLAGALTAAAYFEGDTPEEREVRSLTEELYARADWQWALNAGETVSMGWKPESGFLPHRWEGYNEALILYVLALASPRMQSLLRATRPKRGLTAGRNSTAMSFSMLAHSSFISFHTSGSTFAHSGRIHARERD